MLALALMLLPGAVDNAGKPFSFPAISLTCESSNPDVARFALELEAAGATDNRLAISRIAGGKWPQPNITIVNGMQWVDDKTVSEGVALGFTVNGKSDGKRYTGNFILIRPAKSCAPFVVTIGLTGPNGVVTAKCVSATGASGTKANDATVGPSETI